MTRARTVVAVLIAVVSMGACGKSSPAPVSPMRAPRTIDDITGIWRSAHQDTLELRKNGTYVLITSVSDALAGDYSLSQDRITMFNTAACGGASGTYRIQVAVKQRLIFTEPDDPCALRRSQLTADPFVYG